MADIAAGLLLLSIGMFIVSTITKMPSLPTRDMGTLVFSGIATAATLAIAGAMWVMMS